MWELRAIIRVITCNHFLYLSSSGYYTYIILQNKYIIISFIIFFLLIVEDVRVNVFMLTAYIQRAQNLQNYELKTMD